MTQRRHIGPMHKSRSKFAKNRPRDNNGEHLMINLPLLDQVFLSQIFRYLQKHDVLSTYDSRHLIFEHYMNL